MTLDQPILWLGLAGFTASQRALLSALVSAQPDGWPNWQIAKFSEADAWCVNGQSVNVLGDGTLRVPSATPSDPNLQINLQDVDRPIAFATPLPVGFEPACTFDASNSNSVRGMLQQFEGFLRPLRSQFYLGAMLADREPTLRIGVYHIMLKGALLAVIDLPGRRVGFAPSARPVDLREANWEKRPPSANDIPDQFVRASLTQVMWNYAQHTEHDVLPARYRSGTIYFRRPPRVPLRVLRDSHLVLLRELAAAPATFDELLRRTALEPRSMARDLASLYFAGSITSVKENANAGVSAREPQDMVGWPMSTGASVNSSMSSAHLWDQADTRMADPAERPRYGGGKTVPASLKFD